MEDYTVNEEYLFNNHFKLIKLNKENKRIKSSIIQNRFLGIKFNISQNKIANKIIKDDKIEKENNSLKENDDSTNKCIFSNLEIKKYINSDNNNNINNHEGISNKLNNINFFKAYNKKGYKILQNKSLNCYKNNIFINQSLYSSHKNNIELKEESTNTSILVNKTKNKKKIMSATPRISSKSNLKFNNYIFNKEKNKIKLLKMDKKNKETPKINIEDKSNTKFYIDKYNSYLMQSIFNPIKTNIKNKSNYFNMKNMNYLHYNIYKSYNNLNISNNKNDLNININNYFNNIHNNLSIRELYRNMNKDNINFYYPFKNMENSNTKKKIKKKSYEIKDIKKIIKKKDMLQSKKRINLTNLQYDYDKLKQNKLNSNEIIFRKKNESLNKYIKNENKYKYINEYNQFFKTEKIIENLYDKIFRRKNKFKSNKDILETGLTNSSSLIKINNKKSPNSFNVNNKSDKIKFLKTPLKNVNKNYKIKLKDISNCNNNNYDKNIFYL